MEPLATNLLALRHARGLPQRVVARRALVTQANLSAIEAGRRDLTVGTLLRIARALEARPTELLEPLRRRRASLGRFVADATARAAITGRRDLRPELNDLAAGLAWFNRPVLLAASAPGVRRASRRAWNRCRYRWEPVLLEQLAARVRKLVRPPRQERNRR